MAFKNGRVPQDKLITFASGWLPNEGTWYHQLPPGTFAKHLSLVALAKRNTGRTLKPSEGWSCYRPLNIQEYAKKVHGIWAATPGTSSHGMFWERIECSAIDYGNWSYVYNGDRAAFYRDVRAVGLEPGLISPQRGYPDEPWHVVDKKPWAAGAATAGGAVPFAQPKISIPNEEEEDMALKGLSYIRSSDNKRIVAYFNDVSGFYHEASDTTGAYNTPIAQAWEIRGATANNGSWPELSESDVSFLKRDLAAVRTGKS